MTQIETILKNQGPLLSGQLAEILMKNGAVSKDAARKQIERAKSPVYKIQGFFTDNQSFLYLEEQYQKEAFFQGLRTAFSLAAKRCSAIVSLMDYHYGFIDSAHAPAYSFSPIKKLVGHKLFNGVIQQLQMLNVVSQDESFYRLHPDLMDYSVVNLTKYKAVETAKNFVLAQFNSWARSIGLISYNTAQYYSEFSKFQWAFTAPSYIKSLTRYERDKLVPAFVLADILIGKEATEQDVSFFVEKVLIVTSQRNSSKILPFLIVESVTPEALKKLKENGIVVAFVNKLFGMEYQQLLQSLINTVTNAGAILKKNPEAYLELIQKLNRLVDGKTNNLRGDLFELAVGYYHSRQCQSLDLGKRILFQGFPKEIDVMAIYHDRIVVSECKGYKSLLSLSVVEEWVKEKVPFVRDWILDQRPYEGKPIVFQLWSTGGFDTQALEYLLHISSRTKKYRIEFFDQEQIKIKAKETGSKKFTEILQQYYFGEDL